MPRHMTTGEPTEYDEADIDALADDLDEGFDDFDGSGGGGNPTTMDVTANIEWAGTTTGGPRSTTLDGLHTQPVRESLQQVRAAKPFTSHNAQGWHAQLRELTGSKRGIASADAVGLTASKATVTSWLSDSRAPSAANQTKIREAYDHLRWWRKKKAQAGLIERLTGVLRNRYGAEIRLKGVTDLKLGGGTAMPSVPLPPVPPLP